MSSKRLPVFAAGFILVCLAGCTAWAQQPSTKDGEWPYYTADARGSKYSPLDQINASNFNKLEVAWRFKTDSLGPRAEYKLEGTPLMVKGVIYTTAGTRRSVVALDAKTGELIWSHSVREGTRAALSPRQLSGRGLSYWTDGKGDDRILYVTTGYRLAALNAKTGQAIASFGSNGIVDMKVGAVTGLNKQIDLETGEIGLHATPTVTKDLVLVGSSFKEGTQVITHNNTKGMVTAYDIRTGKKVWQFNTIPKPGEYGYDTWLKDSAEVNGNAGVWTQITVDEDLGLAYLAVEDPTSDQYGGHRPGNNLFADSLVCVDLKTGKRKWHYQVVHHPMWDYDLSSAPLLADINVNGKAIKAVALPSKESFLYVFDRVTGQPVWPIEERPVPAGDVPGEWYSPTQPFPTKPPAYARQAITTDELINFTPELRAKALEQVKMYRMGPMFLPPVVSKVGGPLASLTIGTLGGGTNWPGASYDPETHTVYAQAANAGVSPLGLVEPPPGFSDIRYLAGVAGREFRVNEGPGFGSGADAPKTSPTQAKLATLLNKPPEGAGRGGGPATPAAAGGGGNGLTVDGLILVKPPYGVLSAINLDRGELMWQVPHGDTPDNVRNNPALKGLNISKTGQQGSVGLIVTKTLVILGDPQVTTTPDHPRGAMLRAYDKTNGRQVGAVWMPAPQSGSPMTYAVDGKQYIIVAVSGGAYSGEYIAYSLPQ
ncbi:MAG TPA: PQQ-binding-like beta-propeller repeat protein [Bryobacteraceae bacterium]|jgi:quinoprotein glucose dehydrogenase|nr:PQQ-binding-like beta-propeller repeat protein [Bryobacteraceae bacterium]